MQTARITLIVNDVGEITIHNFAISLLQWRANDADSAILYNRVICFIWFLISTSVI